jgi:cysteine-rich repeat protein
MTSPYRPPPPPTRRSVFVLCGRSQGAHILAALLAVGSLWLENPAPSAGGGEADLDRRRSPEAWKTTQTWRADGSVAAAVGAPSSPALAETCGNSLLDSGEECDDGNADSGDGCSELCLIEEGWTCTKPVPPATGTNLAGSVGARVRGLVTGGPGAAASRRASRRARYRRVWSSRPPPQRSPSRSTSLSAMAQRISSR